jgi:hypothetical protein
MQIDRAGVHLAEQMILDPHRPGVAVGMGRFPLTRQPYSVSIPAIRSIAFDHPTLARRGQEAMRGAFSGHETISRSQSG